jgi:hypothetical protein
MAGKLKAIAVVTHPLTPADVDKITRGVGAGLGPSGFTIGPALRQLCMVSRAVRSTFLRNRLTSCPPADARPSNGIR